MGVPDSNIILMNSLDIACDARNPIQSSVCSDMYINGTLSNEIYQYAQFDYTGNEVNIDNFIKLLTNRNNDRYNLHKRMNTNENSNIFLFMSGHGGDEFFKFQDKEELSAEDIGYMFNEMNIKKLYKEIIFMIDTCQASTLTNYITSPNIITIASSQKGENSYSYINSDIVGTSLIDRFSYSIQQFFNRYRSLNNKNTKTNTNFNKSRHGPSYTLPSDLTFQDLMNSMDTRFLRSTASVIYSPAGSRHAQDILLKDFFGSNSISSNIQNINILPSSIELVEVVDLDN